jgi:hypothetical protein
MADVKISQLDGASSVTGDDLFVMVDDPNGSPLTKKVSFSSLVSSISPSVVNLGSVSGTINTAVASGQIFDLTLAGSGLLANPTGGADGQTLRWRISQDSSGNRALSFGNKFRIPSTATTPLPISSGSGVMDILAATYDSGRDKWDVIAFVPGY